MNSIKDSIILVEKYKKVHERFKFACDYLINNYGSIPKDLTSKYYIVMKDIELSDRLIDSWSCTQYEQFVLHSLDDDDSRIKNNRVNKIKKTHDKMLRLLRELKYRIFELDNEAHPKIDWDFLPLHMQWLQEIIENKK